MLDGRPWKHPTNILFESAPAPPSAHHQIHVRCWLWLVCCLGSSRNLSLAFPTFKRIVLRQRVEAKECTLSTREHLWTRSFQTFFLLRNFWHVHIRFFKALQGAIFTSTIKPAIKCELCTSLCVLTGVKIMYDANEGIKLRQLSACGAREERKRALLY